MVPVYSLSGQNFSDFPGEFFDLEGFLEEAVASTLYYIFSFSVVNILPFGLLAFVLSQALAMAQRSSGCNFS